MPPSPTTPGSITRTGADTSEEVGWPGGVEKVQLVSVKAVSPRESHLEHEQRPRDQEHRAYAATDFWGSRWRRAEMGKPSRSARGLRQSARDLRVDPQVVHGSGHNRDGNRRHTGAVLRRRSKVATLAHRDRADHQPDHDQQQQAPSHALQDTKTGDTTAKRCTMLGVVASPDLCQRRDGRFRPVRCVGRPAVRQAGDTDHHQDDTHLNRLI
jgi:hypothetical protein